jgi:hypothetical protein
MERANMGDEFREARARYVVLDECQPALEGSRMPPASPDGRAASTLSKVMLAICVLCLLGWASSWFMTPRPGWARELPILGVVSAAFAGILRRTAERARRRSEAPST